MTQPTDRALLLSQRPLFVQMLTIPFSGKEKGRATASRKTERGDPRAVHFWLRRQGRGPGLRVLSPYTCRARRPRRIRCGSHLCDSTYNGHTSATREQATNRAPAQRIRAEASGAASGSDLDDSARACQVESVGSGDSNGSRARAGAVFDGSLSLSRFSFPLLLIN